MLVDLIMVETLSPFLRSIFSTDSLVIIAVMNSGDSIFICMLAITAPTSTFNFTFKYIPCTDLNNITLTSVFFYITSIMFKLILIILCKFYLLTPIMNNI